MRPRARHETSGAFRCTGASCSATHLTGGPHVQRQRRSQAHARDDQCRAQRRVSDDAENRTTENLAQRIQLPTHRQHRSPRAGFHLLVQPGGVDGAADLAEHAGNPERTHGETELASEREATVLAMRSVSAANRARTVARPSQVSMRR